MEVAHIDAFHRDPERFWLFYGDRFASLEHREPNGAHRALVQLEERGCLDAVITQNVDRLHAKAGTRELIELHGSIASSVCLGCGEEHALGEVRRRLAADPHGIPRCDCGEPLKPGVVLFGEFLPAAALERAGELAAGADLMLCAGSSLEVYPVAQLPSVTLRSGGALAIVTQGPTPLDEQATIKLTGDVEDELQALVAAL
jgi:NAD-dependent deacetylase